MPNYAVNGVPLFSPTDSGAPASRRRETSAAVRALRELSVWAERLFGLPLHHGVLDVLHALGRSETAWTPVALARQLDLAPADVDGVLTALLARGLVLSLETGPAGSAFRRTPRLAEALVEFDDLVQRAFVSRDALRQSLLVNACSSPILRERIDRLFDRFFDLGWLYLHNWSATCHVMSELVAQALHRQGHATRVIWGEAAVDFEGRIMRLGRPGLALPGQFDGHVFCIVDETVLVDFALGPVRQRFRRDAVWAVAADCRSEPAMLADLRHPLVGRMCWRALPPLPQWRGQLEMGRRIARDLLEAEHGTATTR